MQVISHTKLGLRWYPPVTEDSVVSWAEGRENLHRWPGVCEP